jgi:hypothetical protein
MTTYKNITITESAKGFSFDLVTENWMRPNTYSKNAQTMFTLNQIKSVIAYYLNCTDTTIANGIAYLGKAGK